MPWIVETCESWFARSWFARQILALTFLALLLLASGCGGDAAQDFSRGFRIEGAEPGDCDDGADNDADGLFDCDDTSCAASPLCAGGGAGGEGGTGDGTSGIGGAGGSSLCAGADCDDQNECTEDACDPLDGTCGHTNAIDGTVCDFGGLPGVCSLGVCEDAMLCAGVDCGDGDECTEDACHPMDGQCEHSNVVDGTACDFGGLPGLCTVGVCEDAMLCAGVECDDSNECTQDVCDPMDGECDHSNVADGTACDFVGFPGVCKFGLCEDAMLCADVDCDDSNECTEDVCDPLNGECGHANVVDDTACDFGGLPGLCEGGVCEDAMLCAGVECDDSNECTQDVCDPMDGECDYTNVVDGTACDFGGLPGACTAGVCENAYDYEVIDLGPIGSSGTVRGVNNAGQIIGNSTLSGSSRAFAIDNGNVVDLYTLLGATLVQDINDAGQIVGEAGGAFRHSLSTGATVFISGGAWANGINEAGSVVGSTGIYPSGHGFVWRDTDADGLFDASEFSNLGALPGGEWSYATDINDSDQIVGHGHDEAGFTRPILWENDSPSLLDLSTPHQAEVWDINDAGLIVGSIGDFGVGFTPFLFEPVNAVTTHLGPCCIARGINQQGAVVGGTAGGSFQGPAFLWTSDQGFRALNDLVDPILGWTLVRAWDINDEGWIVGEGNLAGERHGFVLVPY